MFFPFIPKYKFFFVFAFYAEIQDGCQKWRENNFWEKWSLDSADTLLVKNFVKINLCHTVSEINVFLHFTQKFKMAAKNGQENDFWGKSPVDSRYPADQKFRQVSEINTFFAFYAEIQDGHQKWRGNNFLGESKEYTLRVPCGSKFRRNRSISHCLREKYVFGFYAEIQVGHQKWQENDFLDNSPVDSADILWV